MKVLWNTDRNTPISNFPYSPNQTLFSPHIRTRVPVHSMVLVPHICHKVAVLLKKTVKLNTKNSMIDKAPNSCHNSRPQLKERDSVRFRKPGDKHVSPAVVMGKHETPRSYMITDKTGRKNHRNRRHIHRTQRQPSIAI